MKYLLTLILCFSGMAYGQLCETFDTVRTNSVSLITYNSARINGSISHIAPGSIVSLQLKYVRVGQTDTVTSTGTVPLRNITGLVPSTTYYYYYKTICPSDFVAQTIGGYSFTTLANTITYYPNFQPTKFPYLKADTGFKVPYQDTSVFRAPATGGDIVLKPSDGKFYGNNGTQWIWLGVDSAGIQAQLNLKVDSVTVSGDSLFYWVNGTAHGQVVPTAVAWKLTGNAGTTAGTNFLGTTDAVDLVIKTNGTERARYYSNGNYLYDMPNGADYAIQTNHAGNTGRIFFGDWDNDGSTGTLVGIDPTNADIFLDINGGSTYVDLGEPTSTNGYVHFSTSKQDRSATILLDANTGTGTFAAITKSSNNVSSRNFFAKGRMSYFGDTDPAITVGNLHNALTINDSLSRAYLDNDAHDINVGINTATPAAKLHSVGTARFDLGSDATGDIFYRNSSGLFTRLAVGTAAQHLVGGTIPSWVDTATGGGSPALTNTYVGFGVGGVLSGDNGFTYSGNGDYKLMLGLSNTITSDYFGFAHGQGHTVSGRGAHALGGYSTASGDWSGTFNIFNEATGYSSAAMGIGTLARSWGEVAVGTYNTTYTPASATTFNAADRAFVVGYGQSGATLDAFAVWKNGSIGIGKATIPDASAIVEIVSTTKGFLPPRMTATQASAISSPAEGLLVYVTDTNGTFTAKGWWGYDGSAWQKLNN